MNDIKLRDFFAAHIMSGMVNEFYGIEHRENISEDPEKEEWIIVSAKEDTEKRIREAAKMAYRIADALIIARAKTNTLKK